MQMYMYSSQHALHSYGQDKVLRLHKCSSNNSIDIGITVTLHGNLNFKLQTNCKFFAVLVQLLLKKVVAFDGWKDTTSLLPWNWKEVFLFPTNHNLT
ncbi:hypothetical protein PRUPE_3G149400 [Prunus persica]|uniref:Uncharacterized protein n=1 Tax=Prunus persica TaxID=3760 RepID=A0A251Q0H5_PRUPE|nr:hypothetical protein PRUPE_3G149400 [Prunus persica]